jgi:Methyltransferase domain
VGAYRSALFDAFSSLPNRLGRSHPLPLCSHEASPAAAYVELGVHYGGSFVAACSAASRYRTGTTFIGIDNWQGDQHAGSYDGEQAFNNLSSYLQNHFPAAVLYRQEFSEAVSRFDNGSIDILHFDGLHTFDAIQRDFAEWSPKLSSQGIALFHDISLREMEFGVWKFWERLRPLHRTMEFCHSAGLGVAFIGPDQPASVQRLLSLWESNEPFRELFRTTCENVGRLLPQRMAMENPYLGGLIGSPGSSMRRPIKRLWGTLRPLVALARSAAMRSTPK